MDINTDVSRGSNGSRLFSLGQIVSTPGALEVIHQSEQSIADFLGRHLLGDWGELCLEDKQANEDALKDGLRLLSAYKLSDGTRIWVITECDRSATTILLPEEY